MYGQLLYHVRQLIKPYTISSPDSAARLLLRLPDPLMPWKNAIQPHNHKWELGVQSASLLNEDASWNTMLEEGIPCG